MTRLDASRTGRPPVEIRDYRPGDGHGLRTLWLDSGFRLIADDDDDLARFAARNPGSFLVAKDGGRIVGSAMGAWDGRRGWLYHVAAAADHRRLGLASTLVAMVEDVLRGHGCRRCLVLVANGNEGALAFWHAQGYLERDTAQLAKTL